MDVFKNIYTRVIISEGLFLEIVKIRTRWKTFFNVL